MLQDKTLFFIRTSQKIERIFLQDVIYVEGLTNYVAIHTKQKKYVTYLTLKSLEDSWPSEFFVRIHKSYMVPVNGIVSITSTEVELDEVRLPISRKYKTEFMKKIEPLILKR